MTLVYVDQNENRTNAYQLLLYDTLLSIINRFQSDALFTNTQHTHTKTHVTSRLQLLDTEQNEFTRVCKRARVRVLKQYTVLNIFIIVV